MDTQRQATCKDIKQPKRRLAAETMKKQETANPKQLLQ